MSKKSEPTSEPLGDRTKRPHAADGWTVDRRRSSGEDFDTQRAQRDAGAHQRRHGGS